MDTAEPSRAGAELALFLREERARIAAAPVEWVQVNHLRRERVYPPRPKLTELLTTVFLERYEASGPVLTQEEPIEELARVLLGFERRSFIVALGSGEPRAKWFPLAENALRSVARG